MAEKKEKCWVCGSCWWVSCPNDADYTMDVDLRRNGLPLYSGKVDLCGGHARLVHKNGGHMDLNWEAIAQALALEGDKRPRQKAQTL